MGFFTRLSNIVQSKANKALDKMENPVEQLDMAIRQREEALQKAKQESASFIGSTTQKEREIKELKEKIAQYEEGIKKALASGDEEKAKGFLVKKKELDAQVTSLTATLQTLKGTAEKVKASIGALESEVKSLKSKKAELGARYTTAKAQATVNEILTDINKDMNISIADIEDKVSAAENYANGLDSFKEVDMDAELNTYLNTSDISLEDELNQYR